MSYDLHAFRVPSGFTVEEWYENEEREAAVELRAPTDAERPAMERLAAAVLALDPTAERHDGEYNIEFTNADAVQVSIYPDEAAITVPYWYDNERAGAVMARMQEYAAILTEHGLSVYDPQTGETVTGPGANDAYASGVAATQRIAREYAENPPEPPKRRRRWPFGRS